MLTLSEVERGRIPHFVFLVACSFLIVIPQGSASAVAVAVALSQLATNDRVPHPSQPYRDGWDGKPLPASSCFCGCLFSQFSTYPFPASVLLFSWGFTVLRTTINRFSVSNQNGAPNEIASAVITHPASSVSVLRAAPLQSAW